MAEQWRPIPGFGGLYELSNLGEVRSWRVLGGKHKKGERASEPRILAPTLRRRSSGQQILEISLWDGEKSSYPMNIRNLVRDIWMDGPQPGKVLALANGDPTNCSVYNLKYITRAEVNRTKDTSLRKPVVKCEGKEVVDVYRSVVDAAKKNHLTVSGLRNRIRRKTVVDGFYFRFEV